jgi:hypothetical protein
MALQQFFNNLLKGTAFKTPAMALEESHVKKEACLIT